MKYPSAESVEKPSVNFILCQGPARNRVTMVFDSEGTINDLDSALQTDGVCIPTKEIRHVTVHSVITLRYVRPR